MADITFKDYPIATTSIIDLRLMGVEADDFTDEDMKKVCALVRDELKQNNVLHNIIVKAGNEILSRKKGKWYGWFYSWFYRRLGNLPDLYQQQFGLIMDEKQKQIIELLEKDPKIDLATIVLC